MMTDRSTLFVLVRMVSDICGNATAKPGTVKHVASTREECEGAHSRYFETPRSGYHAFRICRWSELDRLTKGRATRWLARRENTTA